MNPLSSIQSRSIKTYASEHSLKGKTVALRIDVNVPLGENGTVDNGEDWRIIQTLPTIHFLVEHEAKVVLLSHIGRDPHESLKPVFEYLKEEITLGFIPSYEPSLIKEMLEHMQHGSVVMLENLRSQPGEKENNPQFLDPVMQYADLYVNDAFSVSHREHASVHGITNILPSYFGLQFIDEVTNLNKAYADTGTKTLVIGGAKFGTKLDLLEKMLPHVEYVLVGGALANVFLKARGFEVGESYVDDVDISTFVDNPKIVLPVDCVDQEGDLIAIDQVKNNDMILDIGHETETLFEQIIAHSDLVIWNGPMGKYEDGYTAGSKSVAQSLGHSQAFSISGGGDTATVILEEGMENHIDFISTAGGAMLDYLVDGSLPAIQAILNQEV